MTFISLADACRRLGIDAKTLRRWLAQAQLPLQSHPHDGRKKGLSQQHLQVLATQHHRCLEPEPHAELASPASDQAIPSSADLLALGKRLAAMQAQLATLQQQMADLSHLLQQSAPQPTIPAAAAKPTKAGQLPARSVPSAPRSHPTASTTTKPARKPAHVLPLVEWSGQGHYVVICPSQGLLSFEPDTPQWFAWLATQRSFRFVGKGGRLTAHRELLHVSRAVWRAHRRMRNHTYNLRLGKTEGLTIAVLEQAAATLQAHLK